MIGLMIIGVLVFLTGHNITSSRRFYPCLITLWLAIVSYTFYEFGPYDQAVELIGYYQVQTVIPLICVLLLSRIPGKLATVLMITSFISIVSSLLAFWLEGHGMYTWVQFQAVAWILLAVELAVMLSPRLTSGVYRAVRGVKLARDPNAGWYVRDSLAYSAKDSSSEAQK
jgi:hypothetical protein